MINYKKLEERNRYKKYISVVEFPAKTPHRAKSRLSNSALNYAMTPKTPITPGKVYHEQQI